MFKAFTFILIGLSVFLVGCTEQDVVTQAVEKSEVEQSQSTQQDDNQLADAVSDTNIEDVHDKVDVDISEAEEADLNNFIDLSWGYRKNESMVQWNGKKMAGADPTTFEVLPYWYAKDNQNIYYEGEIVYPYIDRASFSVISDGSSTDPSYRFLKDKDYVYSLKGKIVEDADPRTFEMITYSYAKDSDSVYYVDNLIRGADVVTFTFVKDENWFLTKDKNYVYQREEKIPDADPDTIALLGGDNYKNLYSKDKNHVFLGIEILDGVAPEGYRLLQYHYAKNNGTVYHYDALVEGTDAGTFEVLGDNYAKDKNNVYYKREVLQGADLATFETSKAQWWIARDKNRAYNSGSVIDELPYGAFSD
ncbi:MAG: hypothetical protein COU72_02665 [Parcubacteria group bacterium CG10_big_fil_rev_8_21_14_0_10_41_35]|nr:MAG: hypothetical protein COU72_02665 [Parcubacteria group bacterium CG10_big_fil_rev_8_21_14_0_10_41_35]